ncbi:hypothetical protein BD410DRAFT_45431 [Rickenella mellea]|uniref:Peptidase A1 domain-containing protein n=1 Tax=Rickenella mellea TaxID=50990 RepID=A0A4R5XGY6_9AGAM|nr:hypothetical protein BD410DRAFT_45431 [Rickenella mellea]
MKTSYISLILGLVLSESVNGLRVPIQKAAGTGNNDVGLTSAHDLLYIANITVGGVDYPVQLDTGSSDLWIKGPSTPLPNTNQTSGTYNLTVSLLRVIGGLLLLYF